MAKCAHCDGTGLVASGAACALCAGTGRERGTKVDEGVKALRKRIGKTKDAGVVDPFVDGTVLRWVSGGRFTYAALRAGGQWWLTGKATYYGTSVLTYEQLSKILARGEVSNVAVASAWSVV